MKRRLILIFLVAAMVITAAACKAESSKSSVSKENGGVVDALPPEDLMELEYTEDICISAEITEYELETLTEQGYRSVYDGRSITVDNGVGALSTKKLHRLPYITKKSARVSIAV